MADEEEGSGSGLTSPNHWYMKKVGPLPLGGWIAVVGGSLGIAWWKRKHGVATTTNAPATSTTSVDTSTAPGVGNLAGYGLVDSGVVSGGIGQTITDNQAWYAAALRQLVGKGYNPTAVDTALKNYLDGEPNDAQGQAIVEQALILLGPPPQPTPAAATLPTLNPAPNQAWNVPATTDSTRARAKLNAARNWYKFLGDGVQDWPEVAKTGALNAADVTSACKAFQNRMNEDGKYANSGGVPVPINGVYSTGLDSALSSIFTYVGIIV